MPSRQAEFNWAKTLAALRKKIPQDVPLVVNGDKGRFEVTLIGDSGGQMVAEGRYQIADVYIEGFVLGWRVQLRLGEREED